MGEGLREVAQVVARVDVELLGVEAERRPDAQQALHQVAGALGLADDGEGGDEPERADQERALLAGQAVVGLVGAVAQHEPLLGQLVGDRQHAGPQARVVPGQEPEDRGEQRRGVERVGLVVLAQDAAGVGAVLEDVGPDLLGRRAPLGGPLAVAADVRELGRAVERHPAHQLRRHVVLRLAARLPDALVGLAPDVARALRLGLHDRPQPARQALAAPRVQQDRVERRAVDVVLALVERAVADAHGPRAGVARQVVARRLGQIAPAVDAVHDLEPAVGHRLEVGHELHELVGLPVEVEPVERLQRERRVAQPGVAVVPVALAPGRLGQRGRERRDGRARRHVGQALDRQRRALRAARASGDRAAARAPPTRARSGSCPPVAPGPRRRRREPRAPRPTTTRRTPSLRPSARAAPRTRSPSIPSRMSDRRRIVTPAPVASAVWRSSPSSAHSAATRP